MVIRHRTTNVTLLEAKGDTLTAASLRGAQLRGASLLRAQLGEADLAAAQLDEADLRYSNLRNASLRGATLTHATLYGAYMAGADLVGCDLRQADLHGAVLVKANLQEARLTEANLACGNLTGANLAGANLSGANLTDVQLAGADLTDITTDDGTLWPDGFAASDGRWAVLPVPRQRSHYDRLRTWRSIEDKALTRLWTIQDLTVWEHLRKGSVLKVDPNLIDPDLLPAYEWMRQQMAHRLVGYQGHYPWWAWYRSKPDLRRHSRSMLSGIRRVRIELAVPCDEVLLSDYYAWHKVLYTSYLAATEAEAAAWDAELSEHRLGEAPWPLPEPWRLRVTKSWERIFDVTGLAAGGYLSGELIQATFEELRLQDVIDVKHFVTR
jgi:hypothetical protein